MLTQLRYLLLPLKSLVTPKAEPSLPLLSPRFFFKLFIDLLISCYASDPTYLPSSSHLQPPPKQTKKNQKDNQKKKKTQTNETVLSMETAVWPSESHSVPFSS